MESQTFLIQLVLILISARVCGELAAYFKAPAVIGELLAGVIIGPTLLGWIDISNPVHLLAQIGIILLLFEVGIETNVGRLFSAGTKSLTVAVGGVILPFILGFLLSYYVFHFSLLVSLFIGSTLTATSIGITLRVLQDLKKQNSEETEIILGAAIIDDIIGIVLLALLYEFSVSGEVNLFKAGKVLLFILLFFALAPILAKGAFHIIQRWDAKSEIPGLLPTTVVSLILLFAWAAHALGAPEILGGFAAGLALSYPNPQEFSHRVEKQMKPIVHLFTPIFFVSIGLSLNLRLINWETPYIWALSLSLIFVAIIGKLLAPFILPRTSFFKKLIIGTAMIPRGEVGLIFASVGLSSGIFKDDIYAAAILVIAVTTLAAPFALRTLYTKVAHNSSNS
jgi:Kef-type K+ transport system membrane component KefB